MYSLIHKFINMTEEGNIYVYQDGEKQWEQSILVVRSVYNWHCLEFLVLDTDEKDNKLQAVLL